MKHLLPFILLLLSSATLAESGAYRVELIVFRNQAETTETIVKVSPETDPKVCLIEAQEFRSFSQFPGLAETAQAELVIEDTADGLTKELPNDLSDVVRFDLPDDLHIISQKSSRMQGVWRRLNNSSKYQPLVYAAWQQNRIDYYPPMRIHDQRIIDTRLRPPTHIMLAKLAAEDPLAAYRSTFYQLDGSLQLKRSRFLHLFLDLEYREEILHAQTMPQFFAENDIQTEAGNGMVSNNDYDVFTLKQNRQIRTGQVQYFDTPYFGALVFVSNISANSVKPN